jgi:nicotinamide phosphoribosyltransferase
MLQRSGDGAFRTVALSRESASEAGWTDALDLVWEDGRLLRDQTFAEVRANSER